MVGVMEAQIGHKKICSLNTDKHKMSTHLHWFCSIVMVLVMFSISNTTPFKPSDAVWQHGYCHAAQQHNQICSTTTSQPNHESLSLSIIISTSLLYSFLASTVYHSYRLLKQMIKIIQPYILAWFFSIITVQYCISLRTHYKNL